MKTLAKLLNNNSELFIITLGCCVILIMKHYGLIGALLK